MILSIPVEEMRAAELEILKAIQRHHFPEERRSLTRCGSTVKKSSCLQSLDPILVYSLLRVKGRLRPAQASFDSKNQIILPKNDHVSNLLIEHFHLISGHSGREYVLSLLSEQFWLIKGSSAVRRILSKCVSCQFSSRRWLTFLKTVLHQTSHPSHQSALIPLDPFMFDVLEALSSDMELFLHV